MNDIIFSKELIKQLLLQVSPDNIETSDKFNALFENFNESMKEITNGVNKSIKKIRSMKSTQMTVEEVVETAAPAMLKTGILYGLIVKDMMEEVKTPNISKYINNYIKIDDKEKKIIKKKIEEKIKDL